MLSPPLSPLIPALAEASTSSKESSVVHWQHSGSSHSAHWHSERGLAAPAQAIAADDTMGADAALWLMKKGTAIVWLGDFHNARLLLDAVARRIDAPPKASKKPAKAPIKPAESSSPTPLDFYRYRQKRALRARLLGLLLVLVERPTADGRYSLALRRAPDIHAACSEAWDSAAAVQESGFVKISYPIVRAVPLRELLGITSSHEWRKKGLEIAALGIAPQANRIYPHYGVFSPVRGEYLSLVAEAATWTGSASGAWPPFAQPPACAFDIGTGTGVLAALLARRGVQKVVATDQSLRALDCARANIKQLGLQAQVEIIQADLFPAGRADLLVCNPPWLPAKASTSLDRAVYDEGSRMLLGFLAGVPAHLNPGGQAWLIVSDLAELLGLRSRAMLLAAIDKAGLEVAGKTDICPLHPKLLDVTDPLHAARQQEVTSLWQMRMKDEAQNS